MADRFEDGIKQLEQQSNNPAAPAGQQQLASSTARGGRQALGDWLTDGGYVQQSQHWYTGANREDTSNGWDTTFVENAVSRYDEAVADGTAADYFSRPDATGVVQLDYVDDEGRTYRFGDVFEDGRKIGNLYDDFDQQTADLMMAPWVLDGKQQARIFTHEDSAQRLEDELRGVRRENSETYVRVKEAQAFQSEVDETAEGFGEGGSAAALVAGTTAGGAATGAAAGATIGSIVPGAGTAAGALAGGLVGGVSGLVGGLLNRDELAEQAARAKEITELAYEENNFVGATGTLLNQAAGFTMNLTSPLKQLSHGITDATQGEVGDGESEMYALDGKGESTAPLWAKVASLSATVGDSLLQFVNPVNRAIFVGQMGTAITGEVVQVGTTGEMFDPREGGFDNIFVDDKGNFDPVSAAAGIGKIAIDAVQLAGWRGLANQAIAGRTAIDEGGQVTELAGHRFLLNEAGEVTGSRKTMALLAPSEQIAYWSAARSARVAAMKEGRVATADDLYRAASNLANGSNRLKTAMVNAFGEAYEEAAQAVLEPVALDGELSFKDIAHAAAYGAAAGLGMSLGATVNAPTNDERLRAQAYVIETIRRGEEPGADWDREWDSLSLSEKRIRASRSAADAELTRAALDRIVTDQAATLVASEADAAKAIDSRRSMVERDLKSASTRTDAFHVMTGLLDAGRVSAQGVLLGDTAPAEAVEASASTILRLLENRRAGLDLQVQFLTDRLATLDAADPRYAETEQMLRAAELSSAVGANLLADVEAITTAIYDPATDEQTALSLTNQLNGLLRAFFDQQVTPNLPEGFTATEEDLRFAGAHFVSLIQSREPKLDAGSYLALLPRASWELTRTRSDDFLQVNTDILQAINGDFDGDKLRAENQLVLSRERFVQARAGQFLGGAGGELDIAVRNFDAKLTEAVADGLMAEPGQMHDAAEATIDNIATAVTTRYGSLMSPDSLARVLEEFRTSVLAGSEEARVTLLNALAREAGEAINDLGRRTLRNEWLWASKVVRANFQAYQTEYRKLRILEAEGPTEEIALDEFDTPEGTNRRKDRAVTDAQTLALFANGNTLFRKFQKIHYTWFNASVLEAGRAEQADLFEMARFYEELGRGVTRAELARTNTDDSVAGRVLVMLSRLVESAMQDPDLAGKFSPATAMTVLANVKVKDVGFVDGEPVVLDGNQDLSLVQLLLKRALDADREEHARTFDTDEKLQAKHARLRGMTVPNSVSDSVNAQRAFIEVFKAVPFGDAMGGRTGALEPHTTPEQWLRNYVSLDAAGRQDMERLFTNVPEYLDRKDRSNLPYSFDEAARREVTAYRSMLDAMMAVGRASLTFDPSKPAGEAFSGDLAEVSKRAAEDFRVAHDLIRSALRDYRKLASRRDRKRKTDAELAQEMFAANPQRARELLATIPDSAAAAVFEYRDGELYVAPWIYETFGIEDSNEALFYYWKNLTLAQWNATLLGLHEDTTEAPGRAYSRLQSRFQRLLYTLAKEPGQPHLELLIRRMDEAKDLDEFFKWVNATPGIKPPGQAVLLPFNDDVADFEADAGGGWVTIKAGSDLRSAITKLRRGAAQLQRSMEFRESKDATDRVLLEGIKRALTDDPQATPLDRENLRKLRRAVAVSTELPRGFAPSAMLALTQGATRGFDAQSHDKGRTATSYGPLGEFQALMDAFAFVPGLERVMETLTAHSVGSLRTNLGDLAKHGGVGMDANGRQFGWERLTVEQVVEMLDDSRTAPLAHALLIPSALDMTPAGLTERPLMEASLKDVLDDDHYKELFRPEPQNRLDQALRYLSLVDAKARAEGGNFDAIRAANDLAIARTSGLGRPATEDDLARLRDQAYIEVAEVLKMVGQLQATPDTRDSEMLKKLRDAALLELRQQRMSRALPGFTDSTTGAVVEEWVQATLADLDAEKAYLLAALAEQYEGDELTRRTEILTGQYERNAERISEMLTDDLAAATVSRFQVTGDAALDVTAHVQITEYVRGMASFPSRAPESAEVWGKLTSQLQAGRTPNLTATEWATLSRSAMGVYLTDQVLRVASHVALPPFPKGDPAISDARFYKYFDPSFSFLVSDLLADDSPLTAAAVWLHSMAEQPRTPMPIGKLQGVLNRTVLNRQQLGTWTPGLMSQIVEAHQRMDSAAAGQAIAAAGNGPKRQAVVGAATRRTGQVPGPELLTTVSFTADLLTGRSNLIPVTPTGLVEATTMPVAMLDNRFYGAIRLNGVEVGLDTNNLGFEWTGAEEPNPYRYVALERLLPVIERFAATNGIELNAVTVEAEFFHPDSQPVGTWNNAFFEGMSHTLLPDGAESLVATLWSDNGGMISADTQRPLDAGKKGLRAIQPFRRLDPAEVAAAEALWEQGDFAGMLRRKTELVMGYDDGSGVLDPSYFNAVYKHMKLQHIVVGTTEDGVRVALTAEQVIAGQAEALLEPKLVRLSPDVVRTMLGETGDQGVSRFFDDEFLLNPDMVAPYAGISEQMMERFGDGWFAETGAPADTVLANVGSQRVLTVRTMLTAKERNARQERIVFLNNAAADVRAARYSKMPKADVREGYLNALRLAQGSIQAESTSFDFGSINSGFIAPRNTVESAHTLRLLEQFKAVIDANEYSRGWVVADEGAPDYPAGALTLESLTEERSLEHRVVKDDLALVRLDSFQRPERDITQVEERVEKALRYLANSGATVALGSGNGSGDLRFHASQYLIELGYAPVAGSKHLYAPAEFVYQTQNERAYESTLRETKRIRPARNAVTFLATDPIGADENAAILNPASMKLRDRKVVQNIVPSSAFPNFNLPVEDNRAAGLYSRTLAHLRHTLDPANTDARAQLLAMAGADPARTLPVSVALDRFHAKLVNRSTLEPQVGDVLEVGDIIPFLHPDGRVLLYRHGMKLPRPEELDGLLATGGMNVALAKSETEPAATANTGTITAVENRVGYGRVLQLEVPLQDYGNKLQLEWNGMKYVVAPPPDGFTIPPVFRNGTVVDLVSDAASANSKEAFEGRVFGYRNALAFFQFDFTNDLTEFFFPGQAGDPEARVLTYNLLHRLANQDEFRIPFTDANAIAKANVAVAEMLSEFAALQAETSQVDSSWVDRLQAAGDPSAQIAKSVILYLLTPGAQVDNVLRSAGFSHPDANDDNVTTRLVPGLLADLLDHGVDSALHEELIRRFDSQFVRGADGSGFRLHKDWTVEMFDGKGGSIRGYLQFGEAHSSGDNPVLDAQAFDPNEPQSVSPHNTMAAFGSVGAATAHKPLKKSKRFAESFTQPNVDSVWQMLTALPNEKDPSLAGFRHETPAETLRRAAARDEIAGFHRPLNTDEWKPEELEAYQRESLLVLDRLNLYGTQRAMVDTWVRMHLGRPYGLDESGVDRSIISHADAMETLSEIRRNISSGLLPTAGANVPLIDVNHLTTIYLANLNRPDGKAWAPRTETAAGSSRANSWDAWVDIAFGTAFNPDALFDGVYLLAVDGFMHGYQGATSNTRFLPVSTDSLRQRLLMDAETNRMLVSISADENAITSDPTLFASSQAELEDIVAGQRIYGPGREGVDPSSAKGWQRKRIERWRKEVDAPRQVNKTMRGVREAGQTYVDRSTKTSAFFRSLINLRAGNTLFNVALWVAAPFEAFYRRNINTFANVLTGESTGVVGQAQARLADRFSDTSIGAVAQALGLQPTYTAEELNRLNQLVDGLSTRSDFKAMVYQELMYQYPSVPGIGRIEKALEKYAKFGGRMQDPAWGMLPKDLSRVYVEQVMKKISQTQTGSELYSVDMLLTQMARNPQWVMQNDPEAHRLGIAAISQIRSVKPTPLSLAVAGIVDPLTENPKFLVNSTGNILKVLTLFQNFWANFGTTITGLQGASDFMAFWLDGREKKVTARVQAALRGERYDPAEPEYYDMTEVLESLDLADSFIRGGVTHSALFTLGMVAGGLGLSGEDDETKWRRRQAELQGVPMMRDPRRLEADFRNRDAIFLDWLPFGMDSMFRVDPNDPDSRSVAQMNWLARTFISPIIGFERFYNTGDFTEVIHGFKDAIGSHPIVNDQLWNSAVETAASLHTEAVDAAEKGDEVQSGHLLITAVGVLEGMLIENSMINMIYVGRDEWDRDPYVLPLSDSDGTPQRDIEGNVRGNDIATRPFLNDDGEITIGYLGRSEQGSQIRVLTENRATMALIASLFDGGIGESDFWRYNMPVKTREVPKAEVTQEEVEALVKAAVVYQLARTQQPNVTAEEALPEVRNQLYALGDRTGKFFTNDEVYAAAEQVAASKGLAALSVLDDIGREHLTSPGARALFEGLRRGTIQIGDEAMAGVYIPFEMRQQIQSEWSKEIVQEGIDLGLDKIKAHSRMQRIMQGPLDNPDVPGLSDLLWDQRISYNDTQVYGQLNTTYAMGPDGRPWATGFKRDGLLGALGVVPFKPMIAPIDGVTSNDGRGNTVDLVNGINTGLRGLVPFDDTRNIPTDVEIGKAIEKAIEDAMKAEYKPTAAYEKKTGSGSGWEDWGRGWRNFGGWSNWGSGGGGGGGAYFVRMYSLPDNVAPYGNSMAFINTSNPIIRRASIRRERVSSERGRLNQWQ